MKKYLLLLLSLPFIASSQEFQEEIELKELYNEPQTAKVLNKIALNLNYLNLLDSSQNTIEKALKMANQEKNNEEASKSHLYNAIVLQKKGHYYEASNCYLTTIKMTRNDSVLAMAYHLLGTCYKDQSLLDKAEEVVQKSLSIARKKGYKSIEVLCLNSLGLTIFRNKDYYNKALRVFHEALVIANQTNDDNLKSIIRKNIGWIHLLWDEEKIGLPYVKEAIAIQQKSNKASVRQNLFYSYMVLIHYYHLVKKDYRVANEFCQKAIEIAEKYNWAEEKVGVYDYFYKGYKALNNLPKALEYLEKYRKGAAILNEDKILTQKAIVEERAYSDSLMLKNEQQELQRNWLIFSLFVVLVGSLIIYRLFRLNQKKNLEIEEINQNLEKKVAERTQELQAAIEDIKEAMMRGQTLERKRVAADLHDNLGSLLSAIGLSTETVDETHLSEKEKKIFRTIKTQINNAYQEVRMLSHNLQPAELEKEGLYNALEILATKINSLNKIQLDLDLEQLIPQPQNIEFNLYSICLEAINNILKHSKANKAKISFKMPDNQMIMIVSDNGCGMRKGKIDGIGLQNIKSRTEQIKANLEVIFDASGTMIVISLNQASYHNSAHSVQTAHSF